MLLEFLSRFCTFKDSKKCSKISVDSDFCSELLIGVSSKERLQKVAMVYLWHFQREGRRQKRFHVKTSKNSPSRIGLGREKPEAMIWDS